MELSACAGAETAGGASVLEAAVDDASLWSWGEASGEEADGEWSRPSASPGRMVSCPHALSELRSKGGVGTHVVSQPCVAGHSRLVRAPSSYIKLVCGFQEGV